MYVFSARLFSLGIFSAHLDRYRVIEGAVDKALRPSNRNFRRRRIAVALGHVPRSSTQKFDYRIVAEVQLPGTLQINNPGQ